MNKNDWMSTVLSSPLMKAMAENLDRSSKETDPRGSRLYKAVMSHVGVDRTVIDIGAGIGRFAIPMAMDGLNVTAIEPSDEMYRHLLESVKKEGLESKIDIIQSVWPVDEDLHADVTFASLVIQFSTDPLKFINAMERASRNRCILSVHVDQPLAFLWDIWTSFHPAESAPSMLTFSDLYPALIKEGIFADVEIIQGQYRPMATMDSVKFLPLLSGFLGITDQPDDLRRLKEILSAKREQVQGLRTMRTALISWYPRK